MIRVLAVLAIAVLLTGCAPRVDSFSIHRYAIDMGNHWDFPPLDRTVSDPVIASRLYDNVRALRPDIAPHSCAIDFGVRHELSFFASGNRVLHGVMDMGCHTIDLGAGDVRAFDDRIEAGLLGALGLYTRGNGLWPTPIPLR